MPIGINDSTKMMIALFRGLRNTVLLRGEKAQSNCDAIVAHRHPQFLVNTLEALSETILLRCDQAQAYFNAMIDHQDPYNLSRAIDALKNTTLLTGEQAQSNFNAVLTHQNPQGLVYALLTLKHTHLLRGNQTQANFACVLANHNPQGLALAFGSITFNTNLLRGNQAQANFDAIITHGAILCHPNNSHNGVSIWSMMPVLRPTALEFRRMIVIAEEHAENPDEGSMALMNYINANIVNIFGMQGANFNPNQSTHTASVHASVSESATKLLERYQNYIPNRTLDNHINSLSRWVHAHQQRDNKQEAAVRCIERLTRANYIYTDNVSQVSTKQLLALVWVGIHDDNARLGTLEDAKNQLIEGLYEIQRGYNISNEGIDNNGPDASICSAGTFNKLIEKLAGVHCDVSVRYITKEVASAKLKIVAIAEANKYLETLDPDTQDCAILKDKINAEDMEYLWSKILPHVKTRMFEEFSSLYPDGIDSESFNNDVNSGIYALTRASVCRNHNTVFESKENENEDDAKQSEDNFLNARNS